MPKRIVYVGDTFIYGICGDAGQIDLDKLQAFLSKSPRTTSSPARRRSGKLAIIIAKGCPGRRPPVQLHGSN
jgi:hypothetical protein